VVSVQLRELLEALVPSSLQVCVSHTISVTKLAGPSRLCWPLALVWLSLAMDCLAKRGSALPHVGHLASPSAFNVTFV
jgi:hypothetical protein